MLYFRKRINAKVWRMAFQGGDQRKRDQLRLDYRDKFYLIGNLIGSIS